MILAHIYQKPSNSLSQQIRLLHKTTSYKNFFSWIVGLLESMFIYCICTQYLEGAPFALITASIRRGMEVISLWHCWGGMEAQVSLTLPSAHLHFLVSCFSFSSWQYPIDSLWGSSLVSLLAHQHHGHLTNFWCFWQCGQVFKKHNGPTPADDIAPQIITDCGNLTLDFKQLGLWASPPFLQTLGPWFPN